MVNHQLCRSTAIDTALSVAGNQLRPEDRVVRQNRQSGCAPLVAILSDAIRGIVGFVLPAVPIVRSESRFGFIEQASSVKLSKRSGSPRFWQAKHKGNMINAGQFAVTLGGDAENSNPNPAHRIRKAQHLRIVDHVVVKPKPARHTIPKACL